MNQPWKVVFAFVGVFIAGAVFGGLFTARSTSGRRGPDGPGPNARKTADAPTFRGAAPIAPRMMQNLTQRLKLTDEQKGKILPIVGRAEDDLQRLRRQNFQDTTRVMERMHTDITGWLSPEQKDDLEKERKRVQERLRKAQEENRDKRNEQRGQQTQATPPGAPVESTAGGPKGN